MYSSQKREKVRKAFIESLGDWKNIHTDDRYGEIEMNLFRFSSVQSLSRVRLFATP